MAECGAIDISCKIGEGGAKVVGSALDAMTQDIQKSIGDMAGMLTTFWMKVPTGAISENTGITSFLTSHLAFVTGAAAVLSLMIGAAKMAVTQRGEAGKEMAGGFAQLVIVALFGVPLISGIVSISDLTANWIVDSSIKEGDFGSNLVGILITGGGGGPVLGFFSMLLMGVLAGCASIVQALLMIVRALMLPILAGTLTLSAAFWTTEAGRLWFKRSITWLIAFIAYKPAAGIIYASGFTLMGDKKILTAANLNEYGQAMFSFVSGVAVMGLAILALPAMIGFAIPVAGKLASGGGGGMATGAAVAGTVAAGAISNGGSNRHTNTQNGPVGANPASVTGPSGKNGDAGSAGKGGTRGASGATVAGSAGAAGAAGSTAAAGATGGISKGIETGAKVVQEVSKQTKSAAEGAAGNGETA